PAKSRKRPAKPAARDRKASPPQVKKSAVIKIGKRLEAVAREIKDADDFIEHVAGLANRYRREHTVADSDAQAELRQSLRTFHKHATALAEWLQAANTGK